MVAQSLDIACVLRRLPRGLQRCPESRFAIAAHRAVCARDAPAFLRLHAQASWLQQALMGAKLQQVSQLLECMPITLAVACSGVLKVQGT